MRKSDLRGYDFDEEDNITVVPNSEYLSIVINGKQYRHYYTENQAILYIYLLSKGLKERQCSQ